MDPERTESVAVVGEEHPAEHDFDQRRDGPAEAQHVSLATGAKREDPAQSKDEGTGELQKSSSMPNALKTVGLGSTQFQESPTAMSPPGRRSTQITRSGRRMSRDFDVRRDGPFGRPSLTMTRRISSGLSVPTSPAVGAPPERRGTTKTEDGNEAPSDEAPPPSDQIPPSIETLQSTTDAAFEPEPPPLNYTLRTRKLSIAIFWSLILIDSIAMPIALYFGLWYGTDLSPNTVFSIVTAALGGISIVEYFQRFYRLWKKGSTCRVIGARRMYLDWFHWNFTAAWIVVMVELIVGTIPTHPPIRLLSMPLASMLYAFGTELLIVDIMRYFEYPAPVRISSIPKGAQLRPGIYSIIEDVCAVDGSGGTEFRENLNRRYEASHIFRAMLRRLGFWWAIGAQAMAVATTIIVFTVSDDAAYVVGWSAPFVWAGIWTLGTIWYVKKKLREEKKAWSEEVATKSNA